MTSRARSGHAGAGRPAAPRPTRLRDRRPRPRRAPRRDRGRPPGVPGRCRPRWRCAAGPRRGGVRELVGRLGPVDAGARVVGHHGTVPGAARRPATVQTMEFRRINVLAAVRLRHHGRAEDRGPASRRGRHRPRVRQPRHPVARRRGEEARGGGREPAQPPLLVEPRHPEAAPGDHRPLPAQVRRRARPRDAGVHHHRRQGGLLAPHVGAARPRRRRAGAEPVVPDPHLGPDPRRRRGSPRAPRPGAGLLRQPARGVGGLVAAAAGHRALVPAQSRRPRASTSTS